MSAPGSEVSAWGSGMPEVVEGGWRVALHRRLFPNGGFEQNASRSRGERRALTTREPRARWTLST